MEIPETDFEDFLGLLLDNGQLEGAAEGITKQVIDQGVGSLSSKQKHVFQTHVLDEYASEDCNRCGADIPWCEKFEAIDNGGFCSWCNHQIGKGN